MLLAVGVGQAIPRGPQVGVPGQDRLEVLGAALLYQTQPGAQAFGQSTNAPMDRSVLPIAEPHRAVSHELNARNAKAPPRAGPAIMPRPLATPIKAIPELRVSAVVVSAI